MRTTLSIDDDVLKTARALARERGLSVGAILSQLARRGLQPSAPITYRDNFPVFEVQETTAVFGPDEVAEALDVAE